MSYFVIAGISECDLFNHAKFVANFLSERLPNFKINLIEFDENKWKSWLRERNIINNWHHLDSPIIWKEFTMRAGKAHLIGGASEFFEYCYDYYNLESLLSKDELEKLAKDNKQYLEDKKRKEKEADAKKSKLIFLILNNDNEIIHVMMMRLLARSKMFESMDLVIRLLKIEDTNLPDYVTDIEDWLTFGLKIELVNNFRQGLDNCDLLILTGDYLRKKDEDFYAWLNRNKLSMENIANNINFYAKNSLRVIVGVHGPTCFNAAVLIDNTVKIHLYNIVAVTADIGFEPLSLVAKLTEMPLEHLFAPPVWGFVGVNHIIDLEHIVQCFHIYRPNLRAVKNNYGSTLQLGTKHTELRYLTYLSDELKSVWTKMRNKDDSTKNLRINLLSKVRAIMNIIDNWYNPLFSENIISLGILSNGKLGIPAGLVFSQPVILKKNRWTPVKFYPKPRKDPADIEDLVPFILDIYKYFNIREDILNMHSL